MWVDKMEFVFDQINMAADHMTEYPVTLCSSSSKASTL